MMNGDMKESFIILLSQMQEDHNLFYSYISSLLFKENDDIYQINRKIDQSTVLIEFLKDQSIDSELITIVENNLAMLVQKISS